MPRYIHGLKEKVVILDGDNSKNYPVMELAIYDNEKKIFVIDGQGRPFVEVDLLAKLDSATDIRMAEDGKVHVSGQEGCLRWHGAYEPDYVVLGAMVRHCLPVAAQIHFTTQYQIPDLYYTPEINDFLIEYEMTIKKEQDLLEEGEIYV